MGCQTTNMKLEVREVIELNRSPIATKTNIVCRQTLHNVDNVIYVHDWEKGCYVTLPSQ